MGYAQEDQEVFDYEANSGKTIITGLTSQGMAATELVIPSTVTEVGEGAFYYAHPELFSLTIDGGNPAFGANLFDGNGNTLTDINMGSGMSVTNMYSLLTSLGSRGALQTVEIGGSILEDLLIGLTKPSEESWREAKMAFESSCLQLLWQTKCLAMQMYMVISL